MWWDLCLHLEQTGNYHFEQLVPFLSPGLALKRAPKLDYIFSYTKYKQQ